MITNNLNYLIARSLDKNYEMKLLKNSEVKKLIKTDYSEAFTCFKKGDCIYRGQWESFGFNAFISIPGYRISQNSDYNVYTRLFSEILPSWKDYPKRNHAFICTNNYNRADEYGSSLFIVFPKNGTKLGICPEEDIWDSFGEQHMSLNRFNNHFIDLLTDIFNLNIYSTNLTSLFRNGTKEKIEKTLAEADEQLAVLLPNDSFKTSTSSNYLAVKLLQLYNDESFDKENISLIKILNEWFNPKTNNFTLIDIKDYSSFEGVNNEIWFDNEALFIPISMNNWMAKL